MLFREGEIGREMFVLQSGRVQLTRRLKVGETVIAVVPQGEFFGEMAIINNRPRTATATVLDDARLLVIDARTFEAMIRDRAEIAIRMIKALAARLDQANQQMELLLLRDVNHRVVQCLRQLAEKQQPVSEGGAAVFIPIPLAALAGRVALEEHQVIEIIGRLRDGRLIMTADEAGYREEGFLIPEVGRLVDFLEFLELKDRFGGG